MQFECSFESAQSFLVSHMAREFVPDVGISHGVEGRVVESSIVGDASIVGKFVLSRAAGGLVVDLT